MGCRGFALLVALCLIACGERAEEAPQPLTKTQAITVAERFIGENGYTDLSDEKIKRKLDGESFELGESREAAIRMRRNTLRPRAIGVRVGQLGEEKGWSVAFDYVKADSSACRVVTMTENGTDVLMQHQDGQRAYFVGFD